MVSVGADLTIVTWDGESENIDKIEKITKLNDNPVNSLNDGKVDPSGRLWIGTMQNPKKNVVFEMLGEFYSYEKGGKANTHLTKIGISNGLAWNKEANKFYYIDSLTGTVDEFDFDINAATICI